MNEKKRNLRPLFWLGGILAAGGLVGGAIWLWNRDNSEPDHEAELEELKAKAGGGSTGSSGASLPPSTEPGGGGPVPALPTTTAGGTGFPLRRGMMNNPLVREMQQALIRRYGQSILPTWGADGDFGAKTEQALTAKGYPAVIDLNTYQQIVSGQGGNAGAFDAPTLARRLRLAVAGRKKQDALVALKSIANAQQYVAVNTIFKNQTIVARSIVSVLIGLWSDEATREQFRREFRRMGLILRDGIWHLPQLNGLASTPQLMTTRVAVLWDGGELTVTVPARTILGTYVRSDNGYTTVKAPTGQLFQVLSNAVTHTSR